MGKFNNKINLNKHIWEGWTVYAFINSLKDEIEMIMNNQSWKKPFKTREELAKWCMDNQPFYKLEIPEVVSYFYNKYDID